MKKTHKETLKRWHYKMKGEKTVKKIGFRKTEKETILKYLLSRMGGERGRFKGDSLGCALTDKWLCDTDERPLTNLK